MAEGGILRRRFGDWAGVGVGVGVGGGRYPPVCFCKVNYHICKRENPVSLKICFSQAQWMKSLIFTLSYLHAHHDCSPPKFLPAADRHSHRSQNKKSQSQSQSRKVIRSFLPPPPPHPHPHLYPRPFLAKPSPLPHLTNASRHTDRYTSPDRPFSSPDSSTAAPKALTRNDAVPRIGTVCDRP